jgi:uncharacterized protein (TIGR02246 family)
VAIRVPLISEEQVMKSSRWMIGAALAAAVLVGGLTAWRAGAAVQKGKTEQDQDKTAKPRPAGKAGKADEAAIHKQVKAFSAAFNKGDLDALVAMWTADAEFIREDGKVIAGKAALRDMLAAALKRCKGHQQSIETRSLRFIRPDVAMEEGLVRLKAPDGSVEAGPYLGVWVKQDGKWLLSSVRDLPDQPDTVADRASTYPHLKQLSWLIGEWTTKGGEVQLSCKWAPNQSFIVQEYAIKQPDGKVQSVTQWVGWDAVRQEVRSWVFDSAGGYGVASWEREGNTWTASSEGALPDGRMGSATNRVRYRNEDSFTWSATDREVDDEPLPDVEVTFTRTKASKR